MAEMYKNIKTGVKAELVEINEKSKQVTLKKEDGKLTASNKSAFEKYWKKIDDNDPSSKKPSSKEKKEEPKKEDKKPVEEKKPEKKAEQPKSEKKDDKAKSAKEEKPKKEKKSRNHTINNSENVAKIVEFINKRISELDGCDIGVPRDELMQFRALRYQGKQFCKLMWSNKSVRLNFRSESVKKIADVKIANYNLPYLYIAESADNSILDIISKMFDVAIADAKVNVENVKTEKKNSKKEKKEEKKNGKNKVR